MRLSHILFIIPVFRSTFTLDCQVSQWSPWSKCFGTCEVALSVRNRDVLVPSIPIRGRRDSVLPCPHLYETRPCRPFYCNNLMEEMPTPSPLSMDDNRIFEKLEEMKTKRPVMAKTWTTRPEIISLGTKTISEEKLEKLESKESASEELIPVPSTTFRPDVVTKRDPGYYINSLTVDLPMKKKMTPEMERRLKERLHLEEIRYRSFETTTMDPEMREVFHTLEMAAELNLPVDEKQIRAALKKNKKLVKSLVEAYRLRKVNKTTTAATTTTTAPTTSLAPIIATSPAPNAKYWPKTGYVPNTRQHASEITSKLYMTKEIIQVLNQDPLKKRLLPAVNEDCPDNSRCCRIIRGTCPNTAEPVLVKRYYRPKGAKDCVAYDYPRCSQADEMEEQPIQFLQNCQDICFSSPEKHISPLYILHN